MVHLVGVTGGGGGVEDVVAKTLLRGEHCPRLRRQGGAGEPHRLRDVRHRGHHGVSGVLDLMT